MADLTNSYAFISGEETYKVIKFTNKITDVLYLAILVSIKNSIVNENMTNNEGYFVYDLNDFKETVGDTLDHISNHIFRTKEEVNEWLTYLESPICDDCLEEMQSKKNITIN